MGTWPFICSVLRSEPLCFSERSQQLYTMNILLFLNSTNVARLSHVAISFLFTPGAARQLLQCCQLPNRCLSRVCFIQKKCNKSFWRFILLRIYDFSVAPNPSFATLFWVFLLSCYTCRVESLFLYYLIFILPPPALSSAAPCRIQWHSFLMRLLSLLISVSFCKNEWQLAL